MKSVVVALGAVLGAAMLLPSAPVVAAESGADAVPTAFAADLEDVRVALGIPGMAAAVVEDQELVWAEGFGLADIEGGVDATPSTPFGLASVTKPIAATLIMQLVEEGVIDLDAPAADYGVDIDDGAAVTVRQLLNHTSEGVPGTVHDYNGNRYGLLGGVIEGATGSTFADLLSERILIPLAMTDTALNPIGAWDSTSITGLGDLRRGLGLGESFAHYPDVYSRLARPYQFDEEYDVVPGMYHLIHSPAAGLVSSVTDLAKFDVALDQGVVLSESARAEMFAPSISTVRGRSDVAYGLGWYVQDFEGMELLWHTGRWPPSTSALYVKVPGEELTFVVLANTDNLTVPFPGIGSGDVSRSTLFLTFFRHYLFPIRHGYELPPIEWSGDQANLVAQLAAVGDGASLAFLERELWSFRQAFASSGQHEQAAALMDVATKAFPSSSKRFDASFTSTAGLLPVVPGALSARAFVWLSRVVAAWLIVVAISIVWMITRLARSSGVSAWEWAVWVAATSLLGPIALVVHRFAYVSLDGRKADGRRQALCASTCSITAYAIGWSVAVLALLNLGDDPNPLAILGSVLLLPLGVGLLAIRVPLVHRAAGWSIRRAARRGMLAELTSVFLGVAVFFPVILFVDNRWLATIPSLSSPFFGAMMSFVALFGLIVLVPLHLGLHRLGFNIWPDPTAVARDGAALHLPTIRNAWWVLLVAFAVMVVAIGLGVASFG
jgi:CubicO group peptidase (beta-lactamase class C family)